MASQVSWEEVKRGTEKRPEDCCRLRSHVAASFLDCEVHSENQSRPDNLPTPIGSFFSDGGSNLGI